MNDEKETMTDSTPLSPQLEKDLEVVRKIVSVAMGALLILVAGFAYNIIVGDGLTFVRPSEELLESERVYKQLINKPSGLTGEGVSVCIVDTGLKLNHPDLDGFDVAGWMDIVQGKSNPYDDNGHGTNMAGILIADGWLDGIAKNVDLYVTKALLENGSGYEEDVVAGIDWCMNQNVNIISLSLGGGQDLFPLLGSSGRTIEDSVNDATARGIFVVAAAGNDGGDDDDGDVASPGSERRVICVGGVTQTGDHWSKSSTGSNGPNFFPPKLPRGDPDKKPEIVAPAKEVPVLNTEGTWSSASGTSAATVFVTGALALLLEAHPELASNGTDGDVSTIDQVKDWMMQTVQPKDGQTGHDDDYGYGLLDIDALLEKAEQESSA
ncbi:MAG: S8 family serine peptidase [Candidatus Poseidoniaceae archaeon]|jgi:serine protease AprX|nr:S8 family serine peptidase [Candidatus Poseidoniaceae archaeon]